MRIRTSIEHNYRGLFHAGRTIRQKFDQSKQFLPLPYAELEDVGLNTKCLANCSYCYTSAIKNGVNFQDIVRKADEVYGSMTMNQRPFQIAIGGSGEPTLHPDFLDFVKAVKSYDILPNYTTNGMHVTEELLRVTEEVCGGVAISYHPHISKVFFNALERFSQVNTVLNAHYIIGEPGTFNAFLELYSNTHDKIKYFVLLPYQSAGRAKHVNVEKEWNELFDFLSKEKMNNLAFGALFYEYLSNRKDLIKDLDLDVYEPEVFSGYRLFDDSYKLLRKSSYDLRPKMKAADCSAVF